MSYFDESMSAVLVGLVEVLDEVEQRVELERLVHQRRPTAKSGGSETMTCNFLRILFKTKTKNN